MNSNYCSYFNTGPLFPSWYNNNPANITPPCIVTMYQYSLFKNTDSHWDSPPFYTSERGYKLQLRIGANGWESCKGTHLSVGVFLMKGEYDEELKWPFNANRITIQLLNWSDDSNHIQDTIHYHIALLECRTRVIEGVRAPGGWGIFQFVSHSVLNDNSDINYINEDKLCFEIISIDII